MKKYKLLTILILTLILPPVWAQENKEAILSTSVLDVTVFLDGAQVKRNKSVALQPGRTKLRFTALSPYIDGKSVQVKASGDVMVLSVNYQVSYDSLKYASGIKDAEKQLDDLLNNIAIEEANKEVINAELNFLYDNSKIGGANNGVSLLTLRETASYYSDRVSSLKLKNIAVNKKLEELKQQKEYILSDKRMEGTLKITPVSEIVLEVECKRATQADFVLTYYVKNAGWYPTYDIRAESIDKPMEIIYKANIHQNTKEEWKHVKLTVSSANPNQGNIAPELKTYYLNYYTTPPRYSTQVDNNQVQGVVLDSSGEPLIGVSVSIPGTTIGTATDIDGKFSLTLPQNTSSLKFGYIGFKSKEMPISTTYMTVYMEEESMMLDEVVVMATARVSSAQKEMRSAPSVQKVAANAMRNDMPVPTTQRETQTSVEFEIKVPYTIKSDNKNTVIEIDRYAMPVDYEYYSIPKITKDAFLLANITDWEQLNLLDGEANVFFENTFVGKTLLEPKSQSDTLSISLGRDRNVQINREEGKDGTSKKFLGTKREDTREWKTSVRNMKSQPIKLIVLDQVPVSTNSEIEVVVDNLSGAILNKTTGEVKWNMEIPSMGKQELDLKYTVKYPKNKTLMIE